MFKKEWFLRHQKVLVWFANSRVGRYILRIHGDRSSIGKNKIVAILPNAIFWKEKKEYKAEFRTHNKFSKRLAYFSYPLSLLAHWWDVLVANNFNPAWNLGFDDFNSNAGGDGTIGYDGADNVDSYATVRGAATGNYDGSANANDLIGAYEDTAGAPDYQIYRGFLPFDTSALPNDATITAVDLVTNVTTRSATPTAYVVQSTQASNTALATADYDQLGATSGGSAAVPASGSFTITLNATGRGWISLTGFTPLGLRHDKDFDNVTPADNTLDRWYIDYSEQTGTSNDPRLTITYPAIGRSYGFFM